MTVPRPDPRREFTAEPGELLDLARGLAIDAGQLLVEGLGRARSSIAVKSSDTDMVTEMDHGSESLIVEGILAARPDDGVIGEEGTDRDGTSGVRWVIDPLDGTTNYLYGHPGFAVSIAAEQHGDVVAAIVFDPLHDDLFSATRGGGAFRNDAPISVSTEVELARALLATGFSYDPDRRVRQATVLETVIGRVRDIRRMGAAAVDLCSVGCGRADAFYEKGLQPWDHAAGALVASEAGAMVGDLEGGPPSGAFCLAATPGLFEQLRSLLREAGAPDA